MTDTPASKPFNIFTTPSPLRVPAMVLLLSAMVVGFGAIGASYALRIGTSLPAPMLVLMTAFVIVGACSGMTHGLPNVRTILYAATATMVAISAWMAFDDIQHRRETDRADRQLAADLNLLCREDGGRNLLDPACARYSRVINNYHYPDGEPPDVRAMRDEVPR